MASDPRDVLTLAEAKVWIGIGSSDTSRDAHLEVYVTGASRTLDSYIGPVVVMSVTGERHDGGRPTITLRHRPVMSISAIEEYTLSGGGPTVLTAETAGTAPTDAYLAEPYDPIPALSNGIVYRRVSGVPSVFEHGEQNIVVAYTAGRAASTTSVDALYKKACGLILKNDWRAEQIAVADFGEYTVPQQSFPAFGLPNVVRDMLAEEIGQHLAGGFA